jgi:Flp pilus assembly protein TadD
VIERSEGKQIPAEYSRLIGDDIFLAGREAAATPIPKGEPIPLPTPATLAKLAATGDTARAVEAIRRLARSRGPGSEAVPPLGALLDQVKESLRDPKTAKARATAALQSCDLLISAITDCIPQNEPQRTVLLAKAHNRRGDALLLMGSNEEALGAFNAALALDPDDAYMLYNRGRAFLAMGRKAEARDDFTKAADPKTKQSGARKLAREALSGMLSK